MLNQNKSVSGRLINPLSVDNLNICLIVSLLSSTTSLAY